ncbi:MAG TPA: hydrogen peroxide-dependent heme synthase [Pseudolysinimonas sp.]|nr:hydrogen peroxide-dependent heme synthase [Pseudolysinimonas sp.]
MTDVTEAPESDLQTAYTLWAVWRRTEESLAIAPDFLDAALAEIDASGVVVRGIYDVSGLRADADILVWFHGPTAEGLQEAVRTFRRTASTALLTLEWSGLGVHREAEFNRSHSPSFMRGLPPKSWVTVYPFVRSYEWYLLPDDERRAMLADHGRKGAEYRGVQANTVASFALGDWEWILALEADDPLELVDLMRHLRATEARRHVREEIPFFTGRKIEPAEIASVIA